MFPVKKFPAVEREEKRVRYESFSTFGKSGAGCLVASRSENCDCSDGKLRPGIGWKDAGLSADLTKLTFPPELFVFLPAAKNGEEKLLTVNEQGKIYRFDETGGTFVYLYQSFTLPCKAFELYGADGTPKVAFCTHSGVWLYDGADEFTLAGPAVSSVGCIFHERLFVAAGEKVYYSAPMDPENWEDSADEGGFIGFPSDDGEFVGAEVLNESVCLFRERGIVVLSAGGAGRDFSARMPGYGGGRIFGESVRAFGNRIVFLAEDGLYAFDGWTAEKICQEVTVFPDRKGQVKSGIASGKYLLVYSDTSGEKKLLVLDGATDSAYFSSLPVDALSATSRGLLCTGEGQVKEIALDGVLPAGTEAVFAAENSDFGIKGRKLWKTVIVRGEGSCRLETQAGEEKRAYSLSFESGEARAVPLHRGENFSLRLFPDAGSSVTAVELVFLVYR